MESDRMKERCEGYLKRIRFEGIETQNVKIVLLVLILSKISNKSRKEKKEA